MTDLVVYSVEELMKELREPVPPTSNPYNYYGPLAHKAADALERQQAVVEAARGVFDKDGFPLPSSFGQGKGNPEYLKLWTVLADIDAPPEGKKP